LELPARVAAATGMQRGEILGVRWTDFDEARTVVRVQRTLQPTRDGLVFEEPPCSLSLPLIARSMDSKST
jgi:integrase